MTGIANAHVSQAPVLILSGTTPRLQENRGALQDMDHTDFVRPLTRYARTVREPELALQNSTRPSRAPLGRAASRVRSISTFRSTPCAAECRACSSSPSRCEGRPRDRILPDPQAVQRAVDLLLAARRPLFISGRGARGAGPELVGLLERLDALYLDTGESRGLVPEEHRVGGGARCAAR